MAKDTEEKKEIRVAAKDTLGDPTLEYIKTVLFEVDISRIGYHGALRRRHELLGDMQEDYDKEFGEEIDA